MKTKTILLVLLLGILLAGSVHADVSERIYERLENFMHAYETEEVDGKREFSDSYKTERKLVDGMLFFILFLSLALLGLRKWYGKSTPAVNGIAISLAALMTLALLSYTGATMGLLFPFAKNILFFIMLFIVYSIVSDKIIKSKGWAFVFALILTLILFNMEGLIEDTARGEDHSVFSTLRKGVDPAYNYKRNVVRPALRVIEIKPEEPTVPITPRATCNDEIQNQGETGIDCGGPCPACKEEPGEKEEPGKEEAKKEPEKKEPSPPTVHRNVKRIAEILHRTYKKGLPTKEDYECIFENGNPKVWNAVGLAKQRTKAGWDRQARDSKKGAKLIEYAEECKKLRQELAE